MSKSKLKPGRSTDYPSHSSPFTQVSPSASYKVRFTCFLEYDCAGKTCGAAETRTTKRMKQQKTMCFGVVLPNILNYDQHNAYSSWELSVSYPLCSPGTMGASWTNRASWTPWCRNVPQLHQNQMPHCHTAAVLPPSPLRKSALDISHKESPGSPFLRCCEEGIWLQEIQALEQTISCLCTKLSCKHTARSKPAC